MQGSISVVLVTFQIFVFLTKVLKKDYAKDSTEKKGMMYIELKKKILKIMIKVCV